MNTQPPAQQCDCGANPENRWPHHDQCALNRPILNPAQDVSDQALAAAFREVWQSVGVTVEASCELQRLYDRARELQQRELPCTDPTNCKRCSEDATTPHAGIPRGELQHDASKLACEVAQVVGEHPALQVPCRHCGAVGMCPAPLACIVAANREGSVLITHPVAPHAANNAPSPSVQLTATPQSSAPVVGDEMVSIPRATLKWWRELVDLNPADLAPRIESALTGRGSP